MALSSDPTGTEIWAEFDSNSKPSKPSGTTYSLDDAHEQVFGAGVHNRLDFANTGQPTGDTLSAQAVDEDSANLRASLDMNGVGGTYYFEWGEGNYNNSTTPTDISGSQLVSETITGLSDNTNYQFRVVFWNGFNSASADRNVGSQETFTTTTSNTTPYNLNASQQNFTEPVTVQATWDNATSAGIIIEWRKYGSSLGTTSLSGNTTSDTQGGFVSGDNASFRVRYTSGDTSWTSWVGTSVFASS